MVYRVVQAVNRYRRYPWRALVRSLAVTLLAGPVALSALASATAAGDLPPGWELQGQWQQGSILRGQLPPGDRLYFLGRPVPVSDEGHFVIGLGRDFPAQATLRLQPADGPEQQLTIPVAPREYRIQRIEGVPARTVTPDPEHLARIREEGAQTRAARAVVSQRQDFRDSFQWPLLGPITGVYGSQRYYNGEPRNPHFGVDVAAPTGTPVRAPVGGKVVLAHDNMFFSGGTLIVDHGQGLSSTFIHLSKLLVEEGAEVEQGDLIAEVGATGRVTGPHLDWRMNWLDQRVDPVTLVPPMEEAQRLASEKPQAPESQAAE